MSAQLETALSNTRTEDHRIGQLPPTELKPEKTALKEVGDFEIIKNESSNPTVRLVTRVERSRGSVHCNPRLSDPALNQVVTFPIDTPIIEELNAAQLTEKIHSDPQLLNLFYAGTFKKLEGLGIISACEQITPSQIACEAKSIINQAVEKLDPKSGKAVYILSKALVSAAIFSPEKKEDQLNLVKEILNHDWMYSYALSKIILAIADSASETTNSIDKGMEYTKSDTRIRIIAGWSILAGSAVTPEQRKAAFDEVKTRIGTTWLDMAGQVLQPLAILGNESQRTEILERASALIDNKYYKIRNGALLTKAMLETEEKARIDTFEAGLSKTTGDVDSIVNGILVMALTAQSPEERSLTFQIAKNFSGDFWTNRIRGTALLALGILASEDREASLRIAAASIEEWDN